MGLFSIPGVGKTRLIGTLTQGKRPDGEPVRILVVRPPTDHTDSMLPADAEKVDIWTVNDHHELIDALEYLRHMPQGEYDWVGLDSVTLLVDHCLDEMWEGIIAEKPHRDKHGLDRGEYFQNMERLARWVRNSVSQDKYSTFWTAHTMTGELPDGRDLLVPHIHVKGMWSKFCGYTNLVMYYEKVQQDDDTFRWVLRLQTTDGYYAKNQLKEVPNNRIVGATMPDVLAKLGRTPIGLKSTTPSKTTAVRRRRRRATS
jgi:hypothetical protein